ncbi:hypothetical protein JQC92_21400 [Shewanella sp. 202IG2-18]|uniref:hypothetical protein n=1 Tax=Parashewanella hymeniacidonis TaxID=2807618 RepID=UPI0019600312|nr:hypothetical protein [Parashewanella hymeniacidonis]MBM7074541.1 hypothetical protein [Parashewanella hymeniacidonis]
MSVISSVKHMSVSSVKNIGNDNNSHIPASRKPQSWESSYNKTYDVSDSDDESPQSIDFLSKKATARASSRQEHELLMRLDQPNFDRRIEAQYCANCTLTKYCIKHKPQPLPSDEHQAYIETQKKCTQEITEIESKLGEAKRQGKPFEHLQMALLYARKAKDKFREDYELRNKQQI